MSDAYLISADARRVPLPDNSVQCIVTSPPYWGLRKYAGEQELFWPYEAQHKCTDVFHEWQEERRKGISGGQNQNDKAENGGGATNRPLAPSTHGTCVHCGAWRGAYGLEPTVEMYVAHSIEILRELRRVLRKDGVLFWNLGDSYASGTRGSYMRPRMGSKSLPGQANGDHLHAPNRFPQNGLKDKDLVLMPARVALAAQADGWWVRSVIIWAKPNPMPESVADRPTDSYEHILMLTKSARYFWDADAVREPLKESSIERGYSDAYFANESPKMLAAPDEVRAKADWRANPYIQAGRNLRNLWDFATQPFPGAHFATFPEELPRRCILAATSARGACAQCGAPWERILEKKPATMNIRVRDAKRGVAGADEGYAATETETDNYGREEMGESRTVGWSPTCRCHGQRGRTRPCVVLDPFAGSGTTGRVAIELNRKAVLLDLAYARATEEDRSKDREYDRLARGRISEVQRVLPL